MTAPAKPQPPERRPCAACGRPRACLWVDDAWVCRYTTCGAEWWPLSAYGDDTYDPPHATTATPPQPADLPGGSQSPQGTATPKTLPPVFAPVVPLGPFLTDGSV